MHEEEMNYPVGKSNFGKIIQAEDSFVDKTLLAKELIDKGAEVTLITRPRRFGKTSNLSMLQHFLAEEVAGHQTKGFFDGLKIDQVEGDYVQKHQGQYPVIFLTLKGVKTQTFMEAREAFTRILSRQFEQHAYLLDSERLLDSQIRMCERYIDRAVEGNDLADGLTFLSHCLHRHTGKRVWILIDEYDTPLLEAHVSGYGKEMSGFMGQFLTEALKDNHDLDQSVITGITRIARENLFSDLNHLKVCTILDDRYSQYFGFTEEEINKLLDEAEFPCSGDEIKSWYNGYHFGNQVIYNPWSIINCLSEDGRLEPYWVNTSQNTLIGELVRSLPVSTLDVLWKLALGETTVQSVTHTLSLQDIDKDPTAIWTLMVMAGYLNAVPDPTGYLGNDVDELEVQLSIPNQEVKMFFRRMLRRWLLRAGEPASGPNLLLDILAGDFETFKDRLETVISRLVSQHDATRANQ